MHHTNTSWRKLPEQREAYLQLLQYQGHIEVDCLKKKKAIVDQGTENPNQAGSCHQEREIRCQADITCEATNALAVDNTDKDSVRHNAAVATDFHLLKFQELLHSNKAYHPAPDLSPSALEGWRQTTSP